MTSTPASRSACATTFAPRSWPSSPGLAIRTFTGAKSARPAPSVGGLRPGATRLRSPCRVSFQPGPRGRRHRWVARKLEDAAPHAPILDGESSHCHGKLKAAGAGASRIEEQHPVPLLLPRLVTVAGNDRAEPRRARVKAQLRHVVQHVQEHAPDLANLSGRKLLGPRAAILVATNARHRRDRADALKRV